MVNLGDTDIDGADIGGAIAYIDAITGLVIIYKSIIGSSLVSLGSDTSSVITLESYGSGVDNTANLAAVSSVSIMSASVIANDSADGGFNDWAVASRLDVNAIYANREASGVETYVDLGFNLKSSSLNPDNSSEVFGVNYATGASDFFSTTILTGLFLQVRYMYIDIPTISLTDLDETIINPSSSVILFDFLPPPAESLTHTIRFRGRNVFSRLVSTYIDVDELTNGSSPTPGNVFKGGTNMVSISNYEGNIWFSNGSTSQSPLSTILNNTVYSLQFRASSNVAFNIVGEGLGSPVDISVPFGDSWLAFPVSKEVKVSNITGPFKGLFSKIVHIIDNKGTVYDSITLAFLTLKPGEGYHIKTLQAFTLTFTL
jgi:hypothetical protein|tara:strand:+ start:2213 stop:3328 length:1116 start_codon:yes stop_codon:yes gene_type:complete